MSNLIHVSGENFECKARHNRKRFLHKDYKPYALEILNDEDNYQQENMPDRWPVRQ